MNILFISRAYPPVIGGIEKQNFEIGKALAETTRTDIIANTRGKRLLPLFLPYALLRALFSIRKYDAVLLGDGVLGILGYLLKLLSAKPVACIVHGLDLTYKNALYQKLWINVFLPRMDRLIAVGNETIRKGVMLGIPETKFIHIPNGMATIDPLPEHSRQDLEAFIGKSIRGGVLLTLGRLVKRKGVAWFIEHVVSQLDESIIYIVAGEGDQRSDILETIQKFSLEDRVFCLGRISEEEKQILFSTTDLFIQPNIIVDGDMEGFGLVVLEAASYGRVVIASDLEGLKDAIKDGQNGFLITPYDAEGYKKKIDSVLSDPAECKAFGQIAKDYVLKNNSWGLIAERYLEVLATATNHVNKS